MKWKRLLASGLALLLLSLSGAGLWLAHDRADGLVHPGRQLADRTPEAVDITDYRTVAFLTPDGLTLRGWFVPSRNGAVVILVHGHAANRAGLLDDAGLLAARGYGLLLYDARNSGESDGTVTTFGLLEVNDVRGAVPQVVLGQPGVDPGRIGLLGHSMGGGTAVLAGAQIPEVRAVVAESAYTSLQDNIANGVRQLTGLPPFPFAPLVVFFGEQESSVRIGAVRPVDAIAAISPRPVPGHEDAPATHGALDEVVPVSNAYGLFAAAREPKELYVIPDAGHSSLLQTGGVEYEGQVLGFLERYLRAP